MKTLLHATALTLVLSAAPAFAQTVEDPTTDPALAEQTDATAGDTTTDAADTTATDAAEAAPEENTLMGFFSRAIPQGLQGYFREEEKEDYQAQLDAAETPQERNAVRQELQRENQARHLERVQETKRERQALRDARQENKGFFSSMKADFDSIVSGKATEKGFSRGERDVSPSRSEVADARGQSTGHGKAGESHGNGGGHGGNHGGDHGGGHGGGNGGGNGHGK